MTGDIVYVFAVLAVKIVLFASGKLRLDVVALLVMFALVPGDVVTLGEAPAGFSNSVILMIAGLFVVGVRDAGGYRFLDFVKAGVPTTILAMIVTGLLIPLLVSFRGKAQPRENG